MAGNEKKSEKAAFDPRRPFLRKTALEAGVTVRALRGPTYTRLHTGIFVASDVEITPLVRAAAALVPFPATAWASHATAARYWELPIPALPHEHVSVLAKGERRRRPDIACHHVSSGLVQVKQGVRVSSPAQTFVELAELLHLVDLVVVGDHLVRKEKCTLKRLSEVCAKATSPGAKAARAALGYVREGVDSPMETRLRMLIVLAGLPEPRVNPLVGDGETLEFRKYDLCWPEVKLIVEYDGRHHIEREEQWEKDLERREKIDDDGWRIIVVTSKDIYRTPGATVAKLHRLLSERGLPGVPQAPSAAWERHFPSRP
ncbi:MAG: DUF559 domain-containing protein [Nocardioides sp.]|nr:DUF559 domain-containing protein [Nocardioides sp.]